MPRVNKELDGLENEKRILLRRVQTAHGVFPDMGNRLFNEHELTDDWATARDASIQYGELRNHRASTKKNDRRGSLWVACDFMDMGS